MHAVSQVASQKRKDKARGRKKGKKAKKELVEKWRQKAGSKAQRQALEQVRPVSSKTAGKKLKPSAKLKYSHLQKRKKKQSKKTAAIKTAEAAEKAEEEESEWNGAIGRVVGETAKAAWQGLVVTVEKAKGSQLLCQIPSKGSQWICKADLECPLLPKTARQTMAPQQLKDAARQSLQADWMQQVDLYQFGQLVTDDQLLAGWREISSRLKPGSAVRWVTPAQSKLAAETGAVCKAMEDFLADSKTLLLVPIHSSAPQHWTLLSLSKAGSSKEEQPEVQYFDTLKMQPETAKAAASTVLQVLQTETELPVPCNRFHQSDGFSCGLWCLQYMERQAREFLGCSQSTWQTVGELSQKLQSWQEAVLKQKSLDKAAKALEAKKAAEKQPEAELPPLPPPEQPPPDSSKAEEAGKTKKKGKVAQTKLQLGWDEQFGCSKCKYSKTGCLACNPAKMLRWAEKQAGKGTKEAEKKSK